MAVVGSLSVTTNPEIEEVADEDDVEEVFPDLRIVALDPIEQTVLTQSQGWIPVTNWFDEKGEDCSPFKAFTGVAGPIHKDGTGYIVFSMDGFSRPTIH